MTAPLTFQGTLAGKRFYVTAGRSGGTVEQLRMFLKRFRTCHTLRMVGQLADQIEMLDGATFLTLEDVAVPAHCLPYLALLSIEASDDSDVPGVPSGGFISIAWDKAQGVHAVQQGGFASDRGNVMQPPDLLNAVRLFNDLRDPIESAPEDDEDAVFEHMLRMGQSQFAHQEALVAGLERLSRVKHVELLVVTNDDTHWNNWVVREEAIGAGSVPANFHAHLAPIGDFEHLLGLCREETLFDLLARKRENGDSEDFKDWIARESSGEELRNPFLARKYRELFQAFAERVAKE